MMTETLSKLYLELAAVLPESTKSAREIALESKMEAVARELESVSDEWDDYEPYLAVSLRAIAARLRGESHE